jgi:hypothetical protein
MILLIIEDKYFIILIVKGEIYRGFLAVKNIFHTAIHQDVKQ